MPSPLTYHVCPCSWSPPNASNTKAKSGLTMGCFTTANELQILTHINGKGKFGFILCRLV